MINPHSPEFSTVPRQFLLFRLGARSYGIPFSRIAEVCPLHTTLPVLQAPAYAHGTVVVHSRRIPVLDLRSMVGAPRHLTAETRLIVAWIDHVSRPDSPLGLLVDAIEHVETLDPRDITPSPDYGPDTDTRFIAGTLTSERGTCLLFDVDHLPPEPPPHFLSETARFLPSHVASLRSGQNRPISAK